MLPKTPSRTDAYVQCTCGGTMRITTVEPIPDDDDHMRHNYECLDCGASAPFQVAKKATEKKAPPPPT
jgi:hypothetical protein